MFGDLPQLPLGLQLLVLQDLSHLAYATLQLAVFLFFVVQLLLEHLELAIVAVEGPADQGILLVELHLQLVDDVVQLVVLLLQIGAVLIDLADVLVVASLLLDQLALLVLDRPHQLLDFAS